MADTTLRCIPTLTLTHVRTHATACSPLPSDPSFSRGPTRSQSQLYCAQLIFKAKTTPSPNLLNARDPAACKKELKLGTKKGHKSIMQPQRPLVSSPISDTPPPPGTRGGLTTWRRRWPWASTPSSPPPSARTSGRGPPPHSLYLVPLESSPQPSLLRSDGKQVPPRGPEEGRVGVSRVPLPHPPPETTTQPLALHQHLS